jgi:HEAT repeat protein
VQAVRRIRAVHPNTSDLPYLIEALQDENEKVKSEVAQALGTLGSRRATEALISALQDTETVVSACHELGRIGEAWAIPAVEHLCMTEAPLGFRGSSVKSSITSNGNGPSSWSGNGSDR